MCYFHTFIELLCQMHQHLQHSCFTLRGSTMKTFAYFLHFAASPPKWKLSKTCQQPVWEALSQAAMPPRHNRLQCSVGFLGSRSGRWGGSTQLNMLCDFITDQPDPGCCQASSLFSPCYIISKLEVSCFLWFQLYLNVPWLRTLKPLIRLHLRVWLTPNAEAAFPFVLT